MPWVAGVDGCKSGWLIVMKETHSGKIRSTRVPHFKDVFDLPEKPEWIAVDIPIGLLDEAVRGGRACDRQARSLLKQPRSSSVFSPPVRGVLKARSYDEAKRVNKRSSQEEISISLQAYSILEKLREVDALMTPDLQKRVIEVHPELCFYEMNNRHPMQFRKRSSAGKTERGQLLLGKGLNRLDEMISETKGNGVGEDDIMDACVACWTAERKSHGQASRIPSLPTEDSRGLKMEIWR